MPEDGFFFAAPGYIFSQQQKNKYNFEALSNIRVRVFNFEKLEKYAFQNRYVFDFYSTAFKCATMVFILRLESFIAESPENRYLNIEKIRPNLEYLSSRKHLAGFLGISANSLSRISKRLKKNKS